MIVIASRTQHGKTQARGRFAEIAIQRTKETDARWHVDEQTLPIVAQVLTLAKPTVTSKRPRHRNHKIPRERDVC